MNTRAPRPTPKLSCTCDDGKNGARVVYFFDTFEQAEAYIAAPVQPSDSFDAVQARARGLDYYAERYPNLRVALDEAEASRPTETSAAVEKLARLLTDAAHHLKEHSSDYDHVSPKMLQASLLEAAAALATAVAGEPQAATQGEREAFDTWMAQWPEHSERDRVKMFAAWQARGAQAGIAAAPTAALPKLPQHGLLLSYRAGVEVYTADQMQDYGLLCMFLAQPALQAGKPQDRAEGS